MLENTIQVDSFVAELKNVVMKSVIKQSKRAAKYETLEIQKAADKYITMIEAGTQWSSFVVFDADILEAAGVDKNNINLYVSDKNNIPYNLRERCMNLQRNKIINNYEEKNNYYRMLNGLPSMEDMESRDFVYAHPNLYDVPIDVPVHLLNSEQINYLRGGGLLDELIAENPSKPYLKFLPPYNIDYYTARTANNYELLYAPTTSQESIAVDYKTLYKKARDYFMIGIYNKQYSNMYEYYDEFIGLSIMTMTIHRTIGNMYKQGIAREFYDIQLIKYLFESYSIPYIEDLSINYQLILAKNLNLLLTYKSTNKVFYDITAMFDMSHISIYKYYLIKEHKLDLDGKPIFAEKEKIDEITGEPTGEMVPDYEKMFDFHFKKINLKEEDIVAALEDDSNRIDYLSMTLTDPYWINDDPLYQKLYETNFNRIISKYMSMDVVIKIYEMMWECCTTLRMFIDNQKDFKGITIEDDRLSENPINLYDLTIFLCALGSKKYGLDGKIPLIGYQVANVYGFNYHTDLEKIREDIMTHAEDFKYIDQTVLKYINTMNAVTIEDVDRLYENITAFREFVAKAMATTTDKEVYYCYKRLYKSLLVVEDKDILYERLDGKLAKTYLELLHSIRPDLAITVENLITEKDLEDMINHVFFKLSQLSDSYEYLANINQNDVMVEAILKLIRFFKSYTVDFVNSGLLYIFDDPYFCSLKVMDYMHRISACITLEDIKGIHFIQDDMIWLLKALIRLHHHINIKEWYAVVADIFINDYIHIDEDCWRTSLMDGRTEIHIYDVLEHVTMYETLNDFIHTINDKLYDIYANIYLYDKIHLIHDIVVKAMMKLKTSINIYDVLYYICKTNEEKDIINISDKLEMYFGIELKTIYHIYDIIRLEKYVYNFTNTNIYDNLDYVNNEVSGKSHIKLLGNDKLSAYYDYRITDNIDLNDLLAKIVSNSYGETNTNIFDILHDSSTTMNSQDNISILGNDKLVCYYAYNLSDIITIRDLISKVEAYANGRTDIHLEHDIHYIKADMSLEDKISLIAKLKAYYVLTLAHTMTIRDKLNSNSTSTISNNTNVFDFLHGSSASMYDEDTMSIMRDSLNIYYGFNVEDRFKIYDELKQVVINIKVDKDPTLTHKIGAMVKELYLDTKIHLNHMYIKTSNQSEYEFEERIYLNHLIREIIEKSTLPDGSISITYIINNVATTYLSTRFKFSDLLLDCINYILLETKVKLLHIINTTAYTDRSHIMTIYDTIHGQNNIEYYQNMGVYDKMTKFYEYIVDENETLNHTINNLIMDDNRYHNMKIFDTIHNDIGYKENHRVSLRHTLKIKSVDVS